MRIYHLDFVNSYQNKTIGDHIILKKGEAKSFFIVYFYLGDMSVRKLDHKLLYVHTCLLCKIGVPFFIIYIHFPLLVNIHKQLQ